MVPNGSPEVSAGPRKQVHRRLRAAELAEYIRHYNEARPHRGLQLDQPLPRPANSGTSDGRVIRHDVLGGIVHEYERAA
jgi:putative transposase